MGKKQKCPEFENHERWLVSFADMMTLLFALFVVLFSLKEGSNAPEIDQAAGAVQESFNDVMEDIPVDRRIGPQEVGVGIFDNMKGDTPVQETIPRNPTQEQKMKIIDEELDQVLKKLRLYGPGKTPDQKDPGQARVISVLRDDDGITLQLAGSHFYASGGYKVRQSAVKDLNEVAKVVKDLGRKVTIEGHTDSVPPSGTLGNWEISGLRAGYIARHFIQKHGIAPRQLIVAGYADTKPMAPNSVAEGRRLNRRIEIKIHYDD